MAQRVGIVPSYIGATDWKRDLLHWRNGLGATALNRKKATPYTMHGVAFCCYYSFFERKDAETQSFIKTLYVYR